MDPENMAYILLSNKTKLTKNTCNNMNAYQNYYVEWKKPDTKEYMLVFSIYIHFWKVQTKLSWMKGD